MLCKHKAQTKHGLCKTLSSTRPVEYYASPLNKAYGPKQALMPKHRAVECYAAYGKLTRVSRAARQAPYAAPYGGRKGPYGGHKGCFMQAPSTGP